MSTATATATIPLTDRERLRPEYPTAITAEARPPEKWETERLCAYYPAEWWTAHRGHHTDIDDAAVALLEQGTTVCAECPSQPECLAYALAAREMLNTWGGVTEWQRPNLRTKLRKSGRFPQLAAPVTL